MDSFFDAFDDEEVQLQTRKLRPAILDLAKLQAAVFESDHDAVRLFKEILLNRVRAYMRSS